MSRYGKIKRHKHSYRLRKRRRAAALKVLVGVLLAAVLMTAGFFAYKGIIRYTDEHPSDLPSEETSLPSSEPVAEDEASVPVSVPASESSASEVLPPSPLQVKAITLTCSTLEELETLLTAVDPMQYNTVLLTLKGSEGQIYYATGSEHARRCGVVSGTAFPLEDAVALITDAGFIPMAKLYTLKDHLSTHASFDNSYIYDNRPDVTWFDNAADLGGKPWLNPYKDAAAEYLCELTKEAAAAGFKAIVLYGMQYPTTSDRSGITYHNNGLSPEEGLTALYEKLSAAADLYGVPVLPAYLGSCYQEGMNTHIYGCSPNRLPGSPTVPVLMDDLSALQYITADLSTLIPSVSSFELTEDLKAAGIEQYIVKLP